VSIVQQANIDGQPRQMLEAISVGQDKMKGVGPSRDNGVGDGRNKPEVVVPPELAKLADEVEKSLELLVMPSS
jgi:hypothetical protein